MTKRNPYKAGTTSAALFDATTKAGRGGARQGAGRPPADDAKAVRVTIRLTPAQATKLAGLGGADFVRRAIDIDDTGPELLDALAALFHAVGAAKFPDPYFRAQFDAAEKRARAALIAAGRGAK